MAALKRALLCLLASAACARSPPSTSAAGGFGRSLEEGVACVDPSLGGVAPSLGSTAISEAGDRSTAQGRHGFAVKRDAWADATVGVLDDDLYFEGVAHGNYHHGSGHSGHCSHAASAGVSMALLEAEAAWALEEGRAHAASAPRIYSEGLRGSVNPLPPGSRLEAEALAAAGLDAAELASARQAEAEALTREAVRMAEAEAAEETPAHELAEAEAAERFAAGFAATTPSPREEEEEAQEEDRKAELAAEGAAEEATEGEEGVAEGGGGEDAADEASPARSDDVVASAAAAATDDAPSSDGASDGGSDGQSSGGNGQDAENQSSAAVEPSMLLERIATLKAEAKKAGEAGNWQQALDGYLEACTMLSGEEGADGGEEGGGVQAAAAGVAKELQSCRLNGGLCALQTQQWSVAIRLCGEALRANPRSATAHHRRAIALQGEGNLDAALWDLRRAAQLQPSSERFQSALAKAEKIIASRPKKPSLRRGASGGADGDMGEMMRQMLSGGSGGAAADGLAGLFGGTGGVGGAGPDMSSMLSMLAGSGGGAGAKGGRAADDDASPLEALLNSPLLAASGIGGKGAGKMIGTITTVLAYQRRAKKLYRMLKPYIPLLFWFVVFWYARPYLLAHVVPLIRPYLPEWAQSCFFAFGAAGAGCETVATAAAAATPVVM